MKKIHILLAFLALASWSACDKIEPPYGEGSDGPINTGDSIVRKVLLEDFTGHTCQGCPAAHQEAELLQAEYGDRLIVLDIHAGYFAKPQTNPDSSYSYDFRNQTATDIATYFNIINQPFPVGMVQRQLDAITNTQAILSYTAWDGAIADQLSIAARAGLKITTTYDSLTRNIGVGVTTTLVADIAEPIKICVYMVEDSLVHWQKNGANNIQYYMHRHALRGSLNGTWGDYLPTPLTNGKVITTNYSGSLVPADANPKQSYIYVILYDDITKQIIQVEDEKLIP